MSQRGVGGGAKSRIVIDVSQAQAEAKAKRSGGRRRKILSTGALVVLGLVLLAGVAGFLWWRSYQRGPAYSLALLLDAARREDAQAVEQLVDAEQVAQGFVPQVIERLTSANSAAVPPQLRGQIGAALPQLIPRVRENMIEEITRGLKQFADDAAGSTPTPLIALGISRMAEIEERGDTARVSLRREQRATELTMRREAERWRVITVRDEALANDIAARLAASLPQQTAQPQENPPRRARGR